jgi:polysaccharide deacetylase family protein (PEP-CTERM system associated)
MNTLTFDIEDWFHILDFEPTKNPSKWPSFEKRIDYGVNVILDKLDEHNTNATFFCLGWIAKRYPYVIKAIHERGHHIGSHSYHHQLVYELNRKTFESDTKNSKFLLEDLVGDEIDAYRAPGFSITNEEKWAFEVLHDLGFRYDASIFGASRGHGGYAGNDFNKPFILKYGDKELIEFPMSYVTVFTKKMVFMGGGYFRLSPKFVLKMVLKSEYNMLYLHPRDFDFNQPILSGLPALRKFKCYYGLKATESKLDYVLRNAKWLSLPEYMKQENMSELKTIKL